MSSGNDKSSNIRTHGDGLSNHTITPNSGNGQHHNNKNETPVVTVPSIALFTIIRTDRNMLLACYSHKHISYRIRTIIRKAIY
ncbi:MAG: hypothetical protein ACRC6C_05280 [Wolbachia pipientis]